MAKTIQSIVERAKALMKKTEPRSITPTEVGQLHVDTLENVDQNASDIITVAKATGTLMANISDLSLQVSDIGVKTDTNSKSSNSELDICDEEGHVLVRFIDGHIKTSHFDSSNIETSDVITLDYSWQSIGDSITWYNDHPTAGMSKGYQTRLSEKINFKSYSVAGFSSGTSLTFNNNNLSVLTKHDLYTIYFGVNEWGNSVALGTLDDYKNFTGGTANNLNQGFKGIVTKIRSLNANAIIMLITPRHSYGFNNFLPTGSEVANSIGVKLSDVANSIKAICEYEGFPCVDLFYESGLTDANVASYSIDSALHPNDKGMQIIANMIYDKVKILA